MGFETEIKDGDIKATAGVNLPRWGLKPLAIQRPKSTVKCVNLPRWGLKQEQHVIFSIPCPECKFTPLGFETVFRAQHSQQAQV